MMSRKIAGRTGILAAFLCVLAPGARAMQSNDPVQQAKTVAREGEQQLAQVRKEVRAENYSEALRVLTKYRDAVKSAYLALKATGRNAEKKPAGFKNLQMHLRHSLQELDQTILSVPPEEREPFNAVRKDLDSIDQELIDALFPRQPSKKSGDTKPRS